METIRYSLIGKEDIRLEPRGGSFEVTLADGSVVVLSALDVAYLLADAYNTADLPSNSSVGQVNRLKDGIRGLWAINQAGRRYSLSGEVLDVCEFGAVGDGATDDTAAIQAALDAVTAGGNVVYFPPGSYLTTAVLMPKANTELLGSGQRNSLIVAGNGQIDTNLLFLVELSNVGIRHLGFYGGSRAYDADGNRTLGNGIRIAACSHIRVDNCYFTKCHNGLFDESSTNIRVCDSEFVIDHRGYTCVYLRGTADGQVHRNYMRQTLASTGGVVYPIQIIDGNNSASGAVLSGNHVSDNMPDGNLQSSALKSTV